MSKSSQDKVRIVAYGDSRRNEWEDYVKSSPDAFLGHLIGWKNVIEKSYGHESCYLIAEENGGIAGILPLFIVRTPIRGRCAISIPYVDCAGICASRPHVGKVLYDEAITLTEKFHPKYVEFRHLSRYLTFLPAKQTKTILVLKLSQEPEDLWNSFNPKLRNQTRKAQKSGLTVTIGGSEWLRDFYDIFVKNMRDIGVPVFPLYFFQNIFREFPERARIAVVLHGDKVIGAAIIMWFKQTATVPWASSLRTYFKYCPNNILYWETIKYCCNRGFTFFDFGRSTIGSGTFRFKRQWDPQVHPLNWEYHLSHGNSIPDYTAANQNYALAVRVWRHLPLGLVRNLSAKIVKYLPGA